MATLYNYMSIAKFERIISSDFWLFSDLTMSNDILEQSKAFHKNARVPWTDDAVTEDEQEKVEAPEYFSCFSRTHSNAAMWYFYGDNHRGVCLGFDIDELMKAYGDELVDINYEPLANHPDQNAQLRKRLSYKLPEWRAEEEIRLFFNSDKLKLGRIVSRDFAGFWGILKYINEIHIGPQCVLRHFIKAIIRGRKELHESLPKSCEVYQVEALLDGRMKSRLLCPESSKKDQDKDDANSTPTPLLAEA